jgi:hypothetical protein
MVQMGNDVEIGVSPTKDRSYSTHEWNNSQRG